MDMDIASMVSGWLDAFLIAPFRWPLNAAAGMWLGSSVLALYAVILGELTGAALFLVHHKYYNSMNDEMIRFHNISVQALHAGDKESYLAANKSAQDHYGKSFFAHAGIGMATLLPLPFLLAWMAMRFEGVIVHTLPFLDKPVGYTAILLSLYIGGRVLFSRCKKRLPLFNRIDEIKREARAARGPVRSFLAPPVPKNACG